MSNVFTPRTATGKRLRLNTADIEFSAGFKHGSGLGFKGRVKIEGKWFNVYGANCGGDNCNCDAVVYPVEGSIK